MIAEGAGGGEGLISAPRPPWLRDDLLAEHRDIAAFVAELAADHDRPLTSAARWKTLRLAQREIGGGPLAGVTAAAVRAWWFGSGQLRRGGGQRSPASRRVLADHLAAFMRWACARGLRADDPLAGLPTVRVPRRDPRPADRAEVDRVLAGADPRAALAIGLAAGVGLRCMEIAALTRDDVQLLDGAWWVWVTRKGGHRLRCALPEGLARRLLAIQAGQPVIASRVGGHLTAAGCSKLISRTFRDAGSPWRAHSLRHLAATELLDATGGDLVAVGEQLGHRDIRTTAGYTRPRAGSVRDALARLDKIRHRPDDRRTP